MMELLILHDLPQADGQFDEHVLARLLLQGAGERQKLLPLQVQPWQLLALGLLLLPLSSQTLLQQGLEKEDVKEVDVEKVKQVVA